MTETIPSYPCLEFACVGTESDGLGATKPREFTYFMNLTCSNATMDHVLHYAEKGYIAKAIHNVKPVQVDAENGGNQYNENWAKIVNYVNQLNRHETAAVARKPIAQLVEKVKAKVDG